LIDSIFLFEQMKIIKPQQAFRFKRSTTPTWSILTEKTISRRIEGARL